MSASLRPLNETIVRQEEEIAQCLWMPLQEYLDAEGVSLFNKEIVRAALTATGVVPTEIKSGTATPNCTNSSCRRSWVRKPAPSGQ